MKSSRDASNNDSKKNPNSSKVTSPVAKDTLPISKVKNRTSPIRQKLDGEGKNRNLKKCSDSEGSEVMDCARKATETLKHSTTSKTLEDSDSKICPVKVRVFH